MARLLLTLFAETRTVRAFTWLVARPSWRVPLGGEEGVYLVDKPDVADYYEALQISRAAQSLIVTKAYRLLAAFYHPDNKETGDPEAFRKVVEAYRVLSDPVRRATYDQEKFGILSSPSNGARRPVQEPAERRTEDERELRRQLLQSLYNVRRTQPHRPSLPLDVIPDLFGCSIDEAQFTLWYLRGKKFIEMTDDGMVITVAGVDHVESNEFSLERRASVDLALTPRSFLLGTGDRVEGEESSSQTPRLASELR